MMPVAIAAIKNPRDTDFGVVSPSITDRTTQIPASPPNTKLTPNSRLIPSPARNVIPYMTAPKRTSDTVMRIARSTVTRYRAEHADAIALAAFALLSWIVVGGI